MKSLNDTLREEFNEVLKRDDLKILIDKESLDQNILNKAFDVLLKNKSNPDLIDKARIEFENYVINQLKTNKTVGNDN